MAEESRVREYFEKAAKDFDDIYDNRGGPIKKLANAMFRKGMRQRFEMALQFCGSGKKSVLDIGCGAGRFTIPLAEKGMTVTGIDYSSEMISLADQYVAARERTKKKPLQVTHLCCNFVSDFDPPRKFDVTLAIGVFDYLDAPLPFLRKMKEVTKGMTVASFPARYTPQMPIRKIWLATKNCPVYFFTKKEIDGLYRSAGFTHFEVIPIAAGFMVKARA